MYCHQSIVSVVQYNTVIRTISLPASKILAQCTRDKDHSEATVHMFPHTGSILANEFANQIKTHYQLAQSWGKFSKMMVNSSGFPNFAMF